MKQPVVTIVGPTAVGKTSLSVEIAKRFGGEVISGDSMQIYKGMDIGTAKVTEEEKDNIPHYMIDIKDPSQSFSVADFQSYVNQYIKEISENGYLPILAGGTGLYIQAALYGYNFSDSKRDDTYQLQIEKEIKDKGIDNVYQRLQTVDPVQAEKIHPNNERRVVRALEVFDRTGMTMTQYHEHQQLESIYKPILIGLEMDREILYDQINKRVDKMIEDGLVEEVKFFYEKGLEHAQSMKAIGYKELIPYLKGQQTLEESVQLLKRNSRRYAKRQYTWFRNKMEVDWYSITEVTKNEKFEIILDDLAGKLKEK
ncbi:tRNA (adenosine(37)-N6)-dimethylallyltransferase MiaA [Aquibacillus koreensis]|uniref:tRNA dimethylallyltransferase n=1 Tax=Aquibacillus koreensis TaxID=279446 RepID=A0A9X3WQY8_9BACI|nr:tRNA (adenosine(37)-N6)-dimethylallyltransferase MiaA [Aquibacillus koreensis]MCT2534607.1 tRNA (adenosine(37)-N6)-dimethylallyltransferase MiaA [Aquibacillus koreensis]MDC3421799.1 tRNA (adenosine(37)-N6)-dimethylallyltransferase MiaA [Aquibacillus koreensis]